MGKSSGTKNGTVAGGRSASHGDEVAEAGLRGLSFALCCVIGSVGAQTWMPVVGLLADRYRAGSLSVGQVSPLLVSYLVALALVAVLFAVIRIRATPSKGIYAALTGAMLSCIGAVLLFLFDEVGLQKEALLFALVGFLLGSGNCLIVMAWSTVLDRLRGGELLAGVFAIVSGCCVLAAFSQVVGAGLVLLEATAVLSVASAVCFAVVAVRDEVPVHRAPLRGMAPAYVRIGVSLGCFGFLFAMMVMQFVIAPHGQASPHTWAFGFVGVAGAGILLGIGRIACKAWDFLFAYRFVAIPVLIAFFPFDPGSDFSLKFALWFSTAALWCFLSIAPGVIREAAAVLHVPVFLTAGIGIGGFCIGSAAGYQVAWFVELIDPTPNYFINVTAIVAMAIGFIGSSVVLTKGSLIRAYRRVSVVPGETDDVDSTLSEKVAQAVGKYGLTNRESDVLFILARGHGLARVQEELYISEGTALTHKRHIYQKLDVHSKSELIDLVARIDTGECDED